jgi:acylphosphatase
MDKTGLHAFVSGRVQGVWFRKNTQEQAQMLGLTGWVRNLSDGRVEVMAFGEEASLKVLEVWLSKGPMLANVIHVEAAVMPFDAGHESFLISE